MTPDRGSDGSTTGFRARFDCLWCGSEWRTRGPGDLEGWAQLCPACLGRAGDNPFLRGRLRGALAARAAGGHGPRSSSSSRTAPPPRPPQAAFPGDWFLRRGEFERGAIHDAAWNAELDMVTRWLDGLVLRGRISEPAAGVGFFSPLLAEHGELHASDADGAALDLARDRLLAHRLRAHLHVGDPWRADGAGGAALPVGGAAVTAGAAVFDAVVAAFLLGRVRGAGLDGAAASLRARLRSGGRLAVIELEPDPAGGPPPGVAWTYHVPAVLEAALARAGFSGAELRSTGRFFRTISALAR